MGSKTILLWPKKKKKGSNKLPRKEVGLFSPFSDSLEQMLYGSMNLQGPV